MADPTRKKSWKRRHPVLTLALLPAIITWTTIRISLKVTAWSVRTTHSINKRRRQRKRAKRQQAIDRQRRLEWEAQQWRNLQRQLQIQQQRQAKLQALNEKRNRPRQRWLKCRRPPPPPPPPPPPLMYCSAQSLEQSRECLFDATPASTTSTTASSAPIATATQPLEQPGERILDPTSTTSPSTTSSASPVSPIAAMESLQSALASSHTAATTPDSITPALTPALSSSTLPSVSSQQPLAPSSSASVPRALPLGTSMIVQGLVQTIEVSRIPARNTTTTTATTTTNEESASVEEARPLLDKGKEKEAGETNDKEISGPLASGSSPRGTPTAISNTPTPDSNNSDSLSHDDLLDDTPTSPSSTMTSIETPSHDTPNTTPESTPATTPRTTNSRPSPSSTEVLGLLLSIAAQATAEALVPWSVPPRSRTTPREGIASGLAAAFSALAGSGTGVTTTNPAPATGMTVSEPLPQPEPIIQPPTPRPPRDSDSQDSSRRFSRRFSRLSISPGRMPSLSSRRISSFIHGSRSETGRRVSSPAPHRSTSPSPRRASSTPVAGSLRRGVLDRIERWVPRRLRRESEGRSSRRTASPSSPLDESVDFGRAPPTSTLPVSALPESSVSPLPSPPLHTEPPTISVPTAGSDSPVSAHTSSGIPTPLSVPTPSTIPTPTTDAEDLIRFSQMLGFTPGIVHPHGTFERFLGDMQEELRVALGEYQDRVRSRVGGNATEGNPAGVESDAAAAVPEEEERSRTAALLDHTRPHVPSTDPLPLNWWRMYRFPALPDGRTSSTGSGSGADSTAPTSAGEATTAADGTRTDAPAPTDTDSQQPIHPAIIIGLRSITRDPTEVVVSPESEGGARPEESGDRVHSSERRHRAHPSESRDRVRSRSRRFRSGEEEERRRDGTRNYIIWIIGGYYPANHPILAHPNLFLGQVHPDELWMLNEFLGQVKPPTASRDDIAKAGLRVVKGVEVQELAKSGSVTENCTERCLICLDDYVDDDDLRIMTCKHMFHKDCVDRWMETGKNNCPACRTKGVETNPSPEPSSAPAPAPAPAPVF
ncbi:unnamed protein product [Rhizoctonia solani]|uniref:RING-type domain-containing protein n=1 Tax=Rhizoctonia solani TaxID=456999 RepID=A0A8H3C1P5_9AGAM|nr:unnamed protein product [Rhizoctonia solani]